MGHIETLKIEMLEEDLKTTNSSDLGSNTESEAIVGISNNENLCSDSQQEVEKKMVNHVPRPVDLQCTNSGIRSELDKILNENKTILSTLSMGGLERKKLPENVINNLDISVINNIKPYTEDQLAAFYTNTELQVIDSFTDQYIEAELKGLAIKKHYLYELLNMYLHVKEKVTGNNLELDQLRREYRELQSQLWSLDSVNISGKSECQDGVTVTASHSFARATFHRSVYQSIFRILSRIQECTYENHALYSYSAEDLKLQIEIYLQTLIENFLNVTQLDEKKAVDLTVHDAPIHWRPYLNDLRLSISVIFAFQRKLIKDHQFIKETRSWLSRLVAILLRVANYQDHLFLLSHILRCPSGVGSWAACFVQMPLSENIECPFSSVQVNHILTVLTIILSPIRERDKFLEDIAQMKDVAQDALWVMIDSEGEEDEEPSGTSLRENDLVALVNQIPLDQLFRALLLVKHNNSEDFYVDNLITENHIMRFFAFSTTFLKIINKGLQTYSQPRYNQFSKRLSRFIRHIVQYASDQWDRFKMKQHMDDSAMLKRLQVEYDSFFLRAVYYLYSSQKLGAWQFLAVVPYNLISINTLWKIFYFLHDSDVSAKELLTPSNAKDFSICVKISN
ncbi:hypothetical protein WA026_010003 [Henosepilachna vigintioctopunctata]|uniref:Uncharacterized protein n=1 Tax=Henosepilachna vigintioctopunctata TaxID=420089 RepID=A0AAW1TLD8_9CUCU